MACSDRTCAFHLPFGTVLRKTALAPIRRITTKCQISPSQERAQTRRDFIASAVLLPVLGAGAAAALNALVENGAFPIAHAAEKASNGLTKLESAVVPVVMCRRVLQPVRRYIAEGEWDKSRTNINYCSRVLAVKKNIRESAQYLEGDAFYDALDIAGELDNTMTQLDATVYTPLFMPSDEGVSIEQRKYQLQAFDYYDTVVGYVDSFLSKVPSTSLGKAKEVAKAAKYQIKVEEK